MSISENDKLAIYNLVIQNLKDDGLYITSAQANAKWVGPSRVAVNISASPLQTSGAYSPLEVIVKDIVAGVTSYYGTSGFGLSALEFTTENGISAIESRVGILYNPKTLKINSFGQLDTNYSDLQNGKILIISGGQLITSAISFSSGSGTTNHSLLTNLDSDDHGQYILNSPLSDNRNVITGTSDVELLSLVKHSSQTKNIFDILNDSLNPIFSISADGAVYISRSLTFASGQDLIIQDNHAASFTITQSGNPYIRFSTLNSAEHITLYRSTTINSTLNISATTSIDSSLLVKNNIKGANFTNNILYTSGIYNAEATTSPYFIGRDGGVVKYSLNPNGFNVVPKTYFSDDVYLTGASKNLVFTDVSPHVISASQELEIDSAWGMVLQTGTDSIILRPSNTSVLYASSSYVQIMSNLMMTSTTAQVTSLSGNLNRLVQVSSNGTLTASLSASQVVMTMNASSIPTSGTLNYYSKFSQSRGIVNSLISDDGENNVFLITNSGISNTSFFVHNTGLSRAGSLISIRSYGQDSHIQTNAVVEYGLGNNSIYWYTGTDASTSGFTIAGGTTGNFSDNRFLTISLTGRTTLNGSLITLGSLSATGTINFNSLSGVSNRQLGVDPSGNLIIVGATSASINGTVGKIPKFATTTSLTNSLLSESGIVISASGNLVVNGGILALNVLNVSGAVSISNTLGVFGGNLTVGSNATAWDLVFNGPTANNRNLFWQTSGSNRWKIFTNSTAETGSNAGSDLSVVAYNDAGAANGTVLTITRSTRTVAFNDAVTVGGTLGVTGIQTNSAAITFNNNGVAADSSIWRSAGAGLSIRGVAGSSYDFALFSAGAGSYIARVPTSTTEFHIVGSGLTVNNAVSMGSSLVVSGSTRLIGNVTINGFVGHGGAAPATNCLYNLQGSPAFTSVNQYGLASQATFNSAAITQGNAFYAQLSTQATSFTMSKGRGMYIDSTNKGSGSTITNLYGIEIANVTAGVNNWAIKTGEGLIEIGGLSGIDFSYYGLNNIRIYPEYGEATGYLSINGGEKLRIISSLEANSTLEVGGTTLLRQNVGVGTSLDNASALYIDGSNGLTGTTQISLRVESSFSSSVTASGIAIFARSSAVGTFTMSVARGIYIADPIVSLATIIDNVGLDIANQTLGTTNYSIRTGTGAVSFGDNVFIKGNGLGIWLNTPGVFTYGMFQSGTSLAFRSGSSTNFLTVTSAGLPTFANVVTVSPLAGTGIRLVTSTSSGVLGNATTIAGTNEFSNLQAFASGVAFSGFGSGGSGTIDRSSINGLVIQGVAGSSYDLNILESGGSPLMRNPIGGTVLEFPGSAATFLGTVGIGTSAVTNVGLKISANLSSTTQFGLMSNSVFTTNATIFTAEIFAGINTQDSVSPYTTLSSHGIYVSSPTKGTNHSITNLFGLKIENQTAGTNNWALKTGLGLVEIGDDVQISGNTTIYNDVYLAGASKNLVFTDSSIHIISASDILKIKSFTNMYLDVESGSGTIFVKPYLAVLGKSAITGKVGLAVSGVGANAAVSLGGGTCTTQGDGSTQYGLAVNHLAGTDATNYVGSYFKSSTQNNTGGVVYNTYVAAPDLSGSVGAYVGLLIDASNLGPKSTGGGRYAMYIVSGVSFFADTSNGSYTAGSASVMMEGGLIVRKNIVLDGRNSATLTFDNASSNGSVATTLGSVGPTGSTAGNPQGWIRINDPTGTDRFIPYW